MVGRKPSPSRPVIAAEGILRERKDAFGNLWQSGAATGVPELHAVQQAFLDAGAMQCGYCTPGMILGAVALLAGNPRPDEAEIVRGMNGHICRCGTYPRIVAAIRQAASAGGGQNAAAE